MKSNRSCFSPTTAARILKVLIERRPELAPIVESLANEVDEKPEIDDLIGEIHAALNEVSAGDVLLNSGRRRGGYREPEEAAAELINSAITPYLVRLEKMSRNDDESASLTWCQAIIAALYRWAQSDPLFDVQLDAMEFVEEEANWAALLWRCRGDSKRGNCLYLS